MKDQELHDMIEQAREALSDEKWVAWALERTGDLNEGALVFAYRAIVEMADRLASNQEDSP